MESKGSVYGSTAEKSRQYIDKGTEVTLSRGHYFASVYKRPLECIRAPTHILEGTDSPAYPAKKQMTYNDTKCQVDAGYRNALDLRRACDDLFNHQSTKFHREMRLAVFFRCIPSYPPAPS